MYSQFTSSPSTWTKITLSYTANYTNPVLYFSIQTAAGTYHYLDDVSVVDTTAVTLELLDNPSFDNATAFAGWDQWCASTCTPTGNGAPGQIISGVTCHSPPYNCFQIECVNAANIYLISQPFAAILGHTYTISFWHLHAGTGSGTQFYVDIF